MHFELHQSFFASLRIPIPIDMEYYRARVWPVLTREKNSQKEILVHSKNQALPNLPINRDRITGTTKEGWTQNSALDDFT
jgi:hypothetical protein